MARELDIIRRLPLTERALQIHRRHMEELLHQAHAERIESTALAFFEGAQPGQGFVEFLAPQRLRPLAQRHNARGGLTGRQPPEVYTASAPRVVGARGNEQVSPKHDVAHTTDSRASMSLSKVIRPVHSRCTMVATTSASSPGCTTS